MADLTSEELQEFARLGGWQFTVTPFGVDNVITPEGLPTLNGLPHFPSNLAACFDVLERFCTERKWTYLLCMIPETHNDCRLGPVQHFNLMIEMRGADEDWPDICAATKQAAIIRAVLAAGGTHG